MATKSSAGWLILAAALAVPGFMAYQFYQRLDAQKRADIERHVRRNLPKDAPIFGSAPGGEKLNNPISPAAAVASTAAAPGSAPATGVQAANAAAAAGSAAAAAVTGKPAPAPATSAPAAAPAAAPGLVPAAAAAVPDPAPAPAPAPAASSGTLASADAASPYGGLLKTGPIAPIVLARDPMLSPYDLVRMAEDELRKRRAQEEVENEVKKKQLVHRAPPERPAETMVDLQGIVEAADGDKAIVNNDVVGEGDMVAGGKIKVVKITPTGVVFSYKNRRFVKGISK